MQIEITRDNKKDYRAMIGFTLKREAHILGLQIDQFFVTNTWPKRDSLVL